MNSSAHLISAKELLNAEGRHVLLGNPLIAVQPSDLTWWPVTGAAAIPPSPPPRERVAPIAVGVDLVEHDEGGGAVFLWGNAAWCWAARDVAGRRLAAVGLVATDAASQRQVAAAFGIDETTLWRWLRAYADRGVAALAPRAKGPKRPSKLTDDKVTEIVEAREEGLSLQAVADRVGVSLNSVSRALSSRRAHPHGLEPGADEHGAPLMPLARPAQRDTEWARLIGEAPPMAPPRITQGPGLPLAGALTILPALAATGLLDTAQGVYGHAQAAFSDVQALLLTMVFAALLGEPCAERLCPLDPADLGRLLGLDHAPEVKTLRRRIGELAAQGKADQLLIGLASRQVTAHHTAVGIFSIDGHVRAYHGKADAPAHHLARMRFSLLPEAHTWVGDVCRDGLLVWQAPAPASLVGPLRAAVGKVRELVGPDARPMICFDRGGYSPKLFAELDAAGFDILSYRKGPKAVGPTTVELEDTFAQHTLADRRVLITYTDGDCTRRLACRQLTWRGTGGHQTQILTTCDDADPAAVAHLMLSRWRQERFFCAMRAGYALDGLDAYATVADDPDRSVPNPAIHAANREVAELRAAIRKAQACYDRSTRHNVTAHALHAHRGLADEIDAAQARLAQREINAKAMPARVPLRDLYPYGQRLDPERTRICDAIRMATYNAESALARLLAGHAAPVRHEARTLLRDLYTSPADLEIVGDALHVRINPLPAPRRTRALAKLCADLTAMQTVYPGTDLELVYRVNDGESGF